VMRAIVFIIKLDFKCKNIYNFTGFWLRYFLQDSKLTGSVIRFDRAGATAAGA